MPFLEQFRIAAVLVVAVVFIVIGLIASYKKEDENE